MEEVDVVTGADVVDVGVLVDIGAEVLFDFDDPVTCYN